VRKAFLEFLRQRVFNRRTTGYKRRVLIEPPH
jgi:hypothetical protein